MPSTFTGSVNFQNWPSDNHTHFTQQLSRCRGEKVCLCRVLLSLQLPFSSPLHQLHSQGDRKAADTDKHDFKTSIQKLFPTSTVGRWRLRCRRMRRWSSCQSPWRSVVGGAYIPGWRPVVGQVHLCLLVTPPTGPLQGLMGTTLCWTCSCPFVVRLSS